MQSLGCSHVDNIWKLILHSPIYTQSKIIFQRRKITFREYLEVPSVAIQRMNGGGSYVHCNLIILYCVLSHHQLLPGRSLKKSITYATKETKCSQHDFHLFSSKLVSLTDFIKIPMFSDTGVILSSILGDQLTKFVQYWLSIY